MRERRHRRGAREPAPPRRPSASIRDGFPTASSDMKVAPVDSDYLHNSQIASGSQPSTGPTADVQDRGRCADEFEECGKQNCGGLAGRARDRLEEVRRVGHGKTANRRFPTGPSFRVRRFDVPDALARRKMAMSVSVDSSNGRSSANMRSGREGRGETCGESVEEFRAGHFSRASSRRSRSSLRRVLRPRQSRRAERRRFPPASRRRPCSAV